MIVPCSDVFVILYLDVSYKQDCFRQFHGFSLFGSDINSILWIVSNIYHSSFPNYMSYKINRTNWVLQVCKWHPSVFIIALQDFSPFYHYDVKVFIHSLIHCIDLVSTDHESIGVPRSEGM